MFIKDLLGTATIDPEKREIRISSDSLDILITLPFNPNPFPDGQDDLTGIKFSANSANIDFSIDDADNHSLSIIRILKMIRAQLNSRKVVNPDAFLTLLEKHIDEFYKEY